MTYWEMPYPQSREHLAELQELIRRTAKEKAPTKPATVPPPARPEPTHPYIPPFTYYEPG